MGTYYSIDDVISIVEDYLAKRYNFETVYLNGESIRILREIAEDYGIEIDFIAKNQN